MNGSFGYVLLKTIGVHEAHEACKEDISKYCKDIQPGRARIVRCLKEHDADISADCRVVLKPTR